MSAYKLTVWAAVVVVAGVGAAGVGRFALPARADDPPAGAGQPKGAAPKADPAPAAVVKGLEAGMWYPYRVDREGRTMDVCDSPQGGMHWGVDPGPDFERLVGLPPTGPFVLKGLSVAKDAAVTVDGKVGKLDDLPAGSQLRLKFGGGGLTVTAIEAKSPPPRTVPVLKAVDAAKGTVTVVRAEGEPPLELTVAPKAYIYPAGKGNEVPLAELAAGMRVTLTTAVEDGRLVVKDIRAWKK